MHALYEACPSKRIPYVTCTVCKSTLLLHTSGPYGVLLVCHHRSFGALLRTSADTDSALRPAAGRGAPLIRAKNHGRQPSCHYVTKDTPRLYSDTILWVCFASLFRVERPQFDGETRKRRGRDSPYPQPGPPFLRPRLVCCFHGRRRPQMTNPLSTASFSRLSGPTGYGCAVQCDCVHPRIPPENRGEVKTGKKPVGKIKNSRMERVDKVVEIVRRIAKTRSR